MSQDRKYDAVVAGAGPAGNTAANRLASQGYEVAVLESDSYVGETKQSTGGTFPSMMASFGIDPEETTMSRTSKTVFEGVDEKLVVDFPGYVLEFGDFKRYQAERAQENGAEYFLDSQVIGLDGQETPPDEGLEVVANTLDGQQSFEADIAIDATGAAAALGRDAGLVDPDSGNIALGVEYEMEGVEMEEPGSMVLKVDYDYAPGGYAWIFDTGEGTAKVGVCGFNDYKDHHEDERMSWEQYFDRFVEQDPRLENAEKIQEDGEHERHAGKAFIEDVPHKVDDNLILAGDTVSSIDPVWGEGIENCMISGREAAVAATHALEAQDFSRETLSRYEDDWERALQEKEDRLQVAHMLYGLDDDTVDRAIRGINRLSDEKLRRLNQEADKKVAAEVMLKDPGLAVDALMDWWSARQIR